MTSSFVLLKIQNEDVLNQIKMYATRKAALEPTKTIMRLFDEIVEETERKTYIGKIQIQHALMESCTSRNTFSVWLFVMYYTLVTGKVFQFYEITHKKV